MIVGNRDRFAIEAQVESREDAFVLGHFCFWLENCCVGNWNDSTDLLGCLRWLRDFSSVPRDRYEPGLWNLPPAGVFAVIYDSVMRGSHWRSVGSVRDAYARFHISHLGMSSFDRFDLLLLKDRLGTERLLWRQAGIEAIHDCYLDPLEMETVAQEFCDRFVVPDAMGG